MTKFINNTFIGTERIHKQNDDTLNLSKENTGLVKDCIFYVAKNMAAINFRSLKTIQPKKQNIFYKILRSLKLYKSIT